MTNLYFPSEDTTLLHPPSSIRKRAVREPALGAAKQRRTAWRQPPGLSLPSTRRDPAEAQQTLPAALRPVVLAALQADAPADYAVEQAGKHYHAINRAHQMDVTFTPVDVHIALNSKVDGAAPWNWRMALVGLGYNSAVAPVPPAELVAQRNRLEYRRGTLTEWYVNGSLGLEQGFTLQEPPGYRPEGESLVVELALFGEVLPALADDGQQLRLTTPDQLTTLCYRHLYVTDALGRSLPVHLELGDPADDGHYQVRVVVDDRAAVYPLTVDPTLQQQAELTASDGANNDLFGVSVAMSSDTAIVGAYGKNSNTGAAYVFVRSGTTWSLQQKLTASDGAAGDQFGFSVGIDGNTVIVGTYESSTKSGAAYVFVRDGSTWSQQQKLTASDAATGDNFGIAVAIYANTALVGANLKNSNTGAAYVFVRSGSTWSQQQKLTASDAATGDSFGDSVQLNNTTAVIGAYGKNSFTGAAYVFVYTGTTWSQQQKLTASDAATGDQFGVGLPAIDGDTLVIGALAKNSNTGAAYVFVRSGSTWSQQQKLTASDAATGDQFGVSMSLYGNILVIGARGKNTFTGAAYVFTRSGTTWTQQAILTGSDATTGNYFGNEVALNDITAIIGAPQLSRASPNPGSAYVFSISPLAPTNTGLPSPDLGVWAGAPSSDNLINLYNGEKIDSMTDLIVPTPVGPLFFQRTYRQARLSNFQFMGLGWTHNHNLLLLVNPPGTTNSLVVIMANGGEALFTQSTPTTHYVAAPGSAAVIDYFAGSPNKYVLTLPDQTTFTFQQTPTLEWKIARRNWPTLEEWDYSYDSTGHLTSVVDPNCAIDGSGTKRQLVFSYFNSGPFNGLLSQVSDQAGRTVQFAYTLSKKLDSTGAIVNDTLAVLTSVTDALGNLWTYNSYGQDTLNETDARQLNLMTTYQSPLVDTTGSGTPGSRITLTKLSYTITGTELVVNGDMELDSDWANIPGAAPTTNARSTTQVHTGTYSRHVVTSAASQGIQSDPFTLIAGLTYIVTAWVYGVSGTVKTQLSTDTGATNVVSSGSGAWQLLRFLYQPRVTLGNTQLQFIGNSATAEFYVDTVSCTNVGISAIHSEDGHTLTDLAVNGDMELDSDWASIPGAAPTTNVRSTTQVHSGTYSRHVVTSAASQGIQGDAFTLVAGVNHTITAWVYPAPGTTVQMQLSTNPSINASSSGSGAWQMLKITYQPGATISGCQLQFIATSATGDFYVDTVSIQADNSTAVQIRDYAFQPSGLNETTETTAGATTTHLFSNGVYAARQDPAGRATSVETNFQYRPAAFVDGKKGKIQMVWTAEGKHLTQSTDAAGNTTQFAYNTSGAAVDMVASSTDALARQTQYLYNDPNYARLPSDVKVYDSDGVTLVQWTHNTYDTHGRLLTQQSLDPATGSVIEETDRVYSSTADFSNGFLSTLTRKDLVNHDDALTTYFYDKVGRVIKSNQSTTFGRCSSSFTLYDALDHTLATLCNYNPGSNPDPTTVAQAIALFNPAQPLQNRVTTFAFDTVGRQVQVTTDAGAAYAQIALTAFDALHRVLRTIRSYVASAAILDPYVHVRSDFTHGTNSDLNLITERAYNERGTLKSDTDVLGNVTLYGYDASAWLVKRIQFASQPNYNNSASGDFSLGQYVAADAPDRDIVTLQQHDANGNLISATDPLGNVTFMAFDPANRPLRKLQNASVPTYNLTVDPTLANYVLGSAADQDLLTTFEYDARGKLRRSQDVLGNWTLLGYDALDRLVNAIRNASQPVYNFKVDRRLANYVVSSAPDQDLQAQVGYDGASRAIFAVDALNRRSWVGYDGLGRAIRSIANATGTATDSGIHDPRSAYYSPQLAPDQDQITLTVYDSSGRPYRTQDRLGNWTLHGYDAMDRLITTIANASNSLYNATNDTALAHYRPAPTPRPTRT